ncbi:MAG: ATP-binding protein [Mycobacteriales bacterium]|nr:MAG: AAA family ATPase [Pseudonocardiales bacterium]
MSLNNPNERSALVANLDLVTQVSPPVLIDEWQLEPDVWDRVRRAVDDDSTGGRFLLAGSAGVAPGERIHSGAGRIVSMAMRPMSFSERGVHEPTVSLRALLEGEPAEITGTSDVDLPAYTDEILRSGLPGIRDLPERARQLQLDSYIARIVQRELPESGVNVRRPGALRAWLTAYATATATNAAYSTILDAATPGEGAKPARQTVGAYREHLQRLFVLDPLEAWIPTFAPLKRLTYTPKHHLVDPAIAARLVGVDKPGLLRGQGGRIPTAIGTWLGALFESLVAQSVRVYAAAGAARVGHLRTKNHQHEVDLIVETTNRSCVAIEAKLANTVDNHDVEHLNWLHEQIGDRLIDRVVVYTGRFAYRRPDGVAVVPLALLGP